jgi:RimJ/RimL family protein N-acetyltransferase
VDDDVGWGVEQFVREVEEIAADFPHAFRQLGFVCAAVEHSDRVTQLMETPDGVWTGETGAAKDQNTHRNPLRSSMLETPRLVLRRPRDDDREPLYAMNSDPRVMQFFPACLTREENDAMIERIEAHHAKNGFGPLTAELRDTGEFVGLLILMIPPFDAHFTPCVEIGWRFAAAHWNQGLATEGARALMRFGFDELHLEEIVSYAVRDNWASRRVMEKLGMTIDCEFDHPRIAEGDRLRRHVLYRKAADRV